MSLLELLGILILTGIFVIFLVVLLKIIRAVMIVGIKNEKLDMEGEGEEDEKETEDSEYDNDEEEGSSTPISSFTSRGTSDPKYWLNAKDDEAYVVPSPARFSYSVEKPIIIRANERGVLGKNGSQIVWTFCKPKENSTIQDDEDPVLFKLHYFDLKNFQPSEKDMVKPHWERDKSYVILECASGGFVYSDMSEEYPSYRLAVTTSTPAVKDTTYTDDRFFAVHQHRIEAGIKHLYLTHLSSQHIVSVKSGFTSPVPILKYMSNGPTDVDLFFFENRPKDATTVPERGEE